MKKIAESLGMGEPVVDPADYKLAGKDVTVVEEKDNLPAVEDGELDTNREDAILNQSDEDLDSVIKEGMLAVSESFSAAKNLEAIRANEARNAGANIMKATIDAIRARQGSAEEAKKFKLKKAQEGHHPQGGPNINVNTIYATREEILEARYKSLEEDDDE